MGAQPQPLSARRYRHVTSTFFDPNAIQQRGDLATYPMAVIGIWTQIDCRLAELLSSFLETPDLRIAMAMYQGLTGSEGKRAALMAAATEALTIEDRHLFQAVLKVIRPSQDRRNEYAHHLWGISTDLPDALLLADPKAWVKHNTVFAVRLKASQDRAKYAELLSKEPPGSFDWTHIKVYEQPVLANDLAAANAASTQVLFLSIALSAEPEANDQVRKLLSSEPPIQQALQDLSRENAPRVHPPLRLRKPSAKQRRSSALERRKT